MMTSKDKLNFISNCIDDSRCDLMQIDIYKKEIEKELELLEQLRQFLLTNKYVREWLNNDK